jgi:hypothetical protein
MKEEFMKTDELKTRLQKNRPMIMVSIRMPEDVVADMNVSRRSLAFPVTSH